MLISMSHNPSPQIPPNIPVQKPGVMAYTQQRQVDLGEFQDSQHYTLGLYLKNHKLTKSLILSEDI